VFPSCIDCARVDASLERLEVDKVESCLVHASIDGVDSLVSFKEGNTIQKGVQRRRIEPSAAKLFGGTCRQASA
jgi:hypothetical protein